MGDIMKVHDIIDFIEKTAPPAFAASWDNSGVQVAALREEARRLAVLLDPSLEALLRAVDAGADFILSHHPLLMQPRYPNRNDEYLAVLSLLLTRNIWLYSAHTSLDANPEGPVRWLAHALGLRLVELLEPAERQGTDAALSGFGFFGCLSEIQSYSLFCENLSRVLGKSGWQSCGPRPERVLRVACCPGSGHSLLATAASVGADLFITGDIKHHAALEAASLGLHVLDVGHFALEEEMMRRFAEELRQSLPVPVTFFPGRDPLENESLTEHFTFEAISPEMPS